MFTQLNDQTLVFQTIPLNPLFALSLNVKQLIDKTLSGANTLSQSRFRSDSNSGVLHIPQSSSITGNSPSDCLMSYPGHL